MHNSTDGEVTKTSMTLTSFRVVTPLTRSAIIDDFGGLTFDNTTLRPSDDLEMQGGDHSSPEEPEVEELS